MDISSKVRTSQSTPLGAINGVEPLVKIDALERATGISRFKWYRLIHDNKIPVYSCGRAVRFRLSEIVEWMKTQEKWKSPEKPEAVSEKQ